jgi:hypothetical protein
MQFRLPDNFCALVHGATNEQNPKVILNLLALTEYPRRFGRRITISASDDIDAEIRTVSGPTAQPTLIVLDGLCNGDIRSSTLLPTLFLNSTRWNVTIVIFTEEPLPLNTNWGTPAMRCTLDATFVVAEDVHGGATLAALLPEPL